MSKKASPFGPSSIPVVILAGGYGTRISEESQFKPKPMVDLGGIPVLVHIMRYYYSFGFNDFVICAGYKADVIKRYFVEYPFMQNDIEVDHRQSLSAPWKPIGVSDGQENWRVRVYDTGLNSMTGTRVARALDEVKKDTEFEHFALTYGDGLCDVDLTAELKFHLAHKGIGTVLGVRNTARYGELNVSDAKVTAFVEKPEERQGIINGGFFFFKKEFRRFLSTEETCVLERQPLAELAMQGQLSVFQHLGFWHAMDTLRDRNHLEKLWTDGNAPWKPRSSTRLKLAS